MTDLKGTPFVDLEYGISIDYVHKWNMVSAIREFLMNANDYGNGTARAQYKDGFGIIENDGAGIPPNIWALGRSIGRDNQNANGQNGEGMTLGMLVAFREKRQVLVETVGYSAYPVETFSDRFQDTVLAIRKHNTNRTNGTRVTVECTKEEFSEATSLFINFTKVTPVDEAAGIYKKTREPMLYINSLASSPINGIFSYSISGQGKEVTNRDREYIRSDVVSDIVRKCLGKATNPDVVTEWVKHGIRFSKNKKWRGTGVEHNFTEPPFDVTPEFKNAVLAMFDGTPVIKSDSYSYEGEAKDSVAVISGYDVIHVMSPVVGKYLKALGIKTVESVIKNTYVDKEKEIVFPITRNWGVFSPQEGVKQVIMNAYDYSNRSPSIKYDPKTKTLVATSYGNDFARTDWLLGESKGRGDKNAVGQYGEGMKIAAVVAARSGGVFKIETSKEIFTAQMKKVEYFDNIDVLVVGCQTKEKPEDGQYTVVTMFAEPGIYNSAAQFFSDLLDLAYHDEALGIIDLKSNPSYGNGKDMLFFADGIRVYAGANSIFGYSAKGVKQHLDRARNAIPRHVAVAAVRKALTSTKSTTVIDAVLTAIKNGKTWGVVETVALPNRVSAIWKKEAEKIFGKKVCFSSGHNPEADTNMKYLGYTVIPSSDIQEVEVFLGKLGYKQSDQTTKSKKEIKSDEEKTSILMAASMTKEEKDSADLFSEVKSKIEAVNPNLRPPLDPCFVDAWPEDLDTADGWCQMSDGKIFMKRHLLSKPIDRLLGVYAHELAHALSKAADGSIEFERKLTYILGVVLSGYLPQ